MMLRKRWRSTKGSGRATTALGVVLVIAAGFVGVIFWTYLQRTKADVARRDHRVLASAVRQLNFRIDGVVEALHQALVACQPKPLSDFVLCIKERIPEIPGARPAQPSGRRAQAYDLASGKSRGPDLDLEDEPGMAIFVEGHPDALQLLVALHQHGDPKQHQSIWVQADLTDSLTSPSQQQTFGAVFLSDGAQNLLYRSDASTVPIGDLRELLLHSTPSDLRPSATPGSAGTTGASPPPSVWDSFDGVPHPIYAGGDDYDVFVKRTRAGHVLHHSDDGSAITDLILIGVASDASSVDESRVLPPTIATAILLVLLLSLLLSPLARLLWIAPQERVKAWHAWFLAGGAFMATGLAFFMLTDWFLYRALLGSNEQVAERVATDIERGLRKQLCDAAKRAEWAQRHLLPSDNTRTPSSPDTPQDGRQLVEFDSGLAPYPFAISLVGQTGQIQRYWDFDPKVASRTIQSRNYLSGGNFSDRRYFADVQTDNLLSICDGGTRFSVDVVRSRLSGRPAVVIALAADGAVPCDSHGTQVQRRVLTIGGQLMSLMTPVLPPGYSFAVVDRTGDVLFHSDVQRAKVENLLDEVDSNGSLAPALRFRRHGPAAGAFSYLGTPVTLYLSPLAGFDDWTLVVVQETKLTQTMHGLVVLRWAAQFGLYVLLLGAAVWLIQKIRPPLPQWMRPRSDRGAQYVHTAFLIVAIVLLASATPFTYPGLITPVGGWLVPVIVLLVLLSRFTWEKRRNRLTKFLLACSATLLALALWFQVWFAEEQIGDTADWIVLLFAALAAVPGFWVCRWWFRRRPSRLASSFSLLIALAFTTLAGIPSACFLAAAYTEVSTQASEYRQVDVFRRLLDRAQEALRDATTAQTVASITPWEWGNFFPTTSFADRSVSAAFEQCECQGRGDQCPSGCGTTQRLHGNGSARFSEALVAQPLTLDPIAAEALRSEALEAEEDYALSARGADQSVPWYSSSFDDTTTLFAALMQWVVGLSPSDALNVQLAIDSAHAEHPTSWRYEKCRDGVVGLCLVDRRLRDLLHGQSSDKFGFAARPSTLELLPRQRVLLLLLAAVSTIVLFFVARAVARRLFVLNPKIWSRLGEDDGEPRRGEPKTERHLFLLTRSLTTPSADECASVLDVRQCEQADGPAWVSGRVMPISGVVVLDHFDHRMDVAPLNCRRLRLLESLAQHQDATIVILAQTDLAESIPVFRSDDPVHRLGRARADVAERRRWVRVLSQFVVHRLPLCPTPDASASLHPAVAGLVASRAAELQQPSEFQRMAIWSSLTNVEKLTLIQLAKERYANFKAAGVLRSLLDRGLITRYPVVAIADETWRNFMLHVAHSEPVREWERELRPRTVDALLIPAGLVFAGCMALLFITQQDFALRTVSAFGGLATLIPIATRLLSASTDRSFAKRDTGDTTGVA